MTKDQLQTEFDQWTYSDFAVWYGIYSKVLPPERVEPSIIYPTAKDSIIVFEVRCNEEISFNDVIRNNDLLFVVEITDNDRSIILHQFRCTTDPCSRKVNIAHTARQQYRGNIGLHRNIIGRWCIRSDYGFGTFIRRTDKQGNPIKVNGRVDAYSDHVGINIHDSGGFYNSSLGCTILSDDNEYQTVFKPLLKKCSNRDNIPVSLFDLDDIEGLLHAKSESGKTITATAEPKQAI